MRLDPTLIEPLLAAVVLFAPTEYERTALPWPVALPLIVTHGTSTETDHAHPEAVDTVNVPPPPSAPKLNAAPVAVTTHVCPGCDWLIWIRFVPTAIEAVLADVVLFALTE